MDQDGSRPLSEVAAIDDPVARFQAAGAAIEHHRSEMGRAKQIRREAIEEMRQKGLSYGQIAELLKITRGRVHEIHHGRA